MKLVLNGTVVTCNNEGELIEDGGVLIDGDEIIAVGPGEELRQNNPQAEIIDAENGLIMPGLINSHMHFYSTFARGMDLKTDDPPGNFVEILEKLWWRLDETLATEEDIYYSAVYALLEGVESGTTTVFDHHASYGLIEGSLDIIRQAVEDVGLRASLCFEVSDRHGEEAREKSLQENIRYLESLKKEERSYLAGKLGMHASFTVEDETLEKTAEIISDLNVPLHLHVAEGRADVEDSQKRGYDNIIDRLDSFDLWQPGTLAIHGVHLTPEEYEILADKNCYLIHNPQSNLSNAVGTADLIAAHETGLDIGLGTDGYTTDMWESLKTADLLPSHLAGDPGAGGGMAEEMLFEVNSQLAENVFAKKLGSLEAGAGADVIIVDYDPPTPVTEDNLSAHLLMGIQGGDVETTIARGNIIMENGEVQVLDNDKIRRKCREQARDVWRRF